ncbi:nuclear transport factor 2 family protein [Roseateles amylovorans]|uniref:Nuclear transport factor 2 family protein n=1 Tax=Roseateles amylovorans TaxID=2978473 RepID=A0ABY6AZR2_9BURK|nr:nuclear transport factor 2 family protein [Roseateles amylovorans]UXH78075.1 nuclear transport factor 2 family protein [Roseateles amylovorans]
MDRHQTDNHRPEEVEGDVLVALVGDEAEASPSLATCGTEPAGSPVVPVVANPLRAPLRDPVFHRLVALERTLHRPQVRRDRQRLDQLLHEQFVEIGYSGRRYTKVDLLVKLPAERADGNEIRAQDFELNFLSPDLLLLAYRCAHRHPDGTMTRFSYCSSLWERQGGEWRLRFHQGTPTQAFETPLW